LELNSLLKEEEKTLCPFVLFAHANRQDAISFDA